MSRARVWILFAAVFAGCPGPSVVDTPDALLVMPRDRAQDVKSIVDVLGALGRTKAL